MTNRVVLRGLAAAASTMMLLPALTGCGQKGPLYLPERTETVIRPAPASQTQPSPGAADPATPRSEDEKTRKPEAPAAPTNAPR